MPGHDLRLDAKTSSGKMINLKGITWNHTRGFTSIVAVSQRFHELHPGVEISWSKRSLQAFADEPIDELARQFDFLIIDHPWAGFASRHHIILPLDEYLNPGFLEDQEKHSVGLSHESYRYDYHQWAIAIDAATPVAASRTDLFRQKEMELPESWEQLVELSMMGGVAIPGIPQDTLMSFYMVCSTLGEDVCSTRKQVVSEKVGIKALLMLRELGTHIDSNCFDMNPIQVYESMTSTDSYLYSPFAYGYSNYARIGYAIHHLTFHDMVSIQGNPLVTTLGGTGLAISAECKYKDIAIEFLEFAGKADTQSRLYFDHGGQPGHRRAWVDDHTNRMTSDYFRATLPALDRAFLRPRYPGHMYFQDRAGEPIRQYMMKGGDPQKVLNSLNALYIKSLDKL